MTGREQMAGVQAKPEPRVAAGGVDQRGELAERAPERAPGAGGVLEVQRAARGLRERLRDDAAGARDRLADVAGLRRAGMQDDRVGAERGAGLQRSDQRAQ